MVKCIVKKMREMHEGWSHFWFSPQDLYNVSLFRCVLGCAMFAFYAIRFTEFDYYFTANGVLPVELARTIIPEGYRSLLPFYINSDSWVYAQAMAHLSLLFFFALGAFGRSLTWVLFILNLGLLQRNVSIMYGADLFSNFWLFYLSFIRHDRYFSVWNLLPKRKGQLLDKMSDPLSSMGMRFIQIQLCLSYAYTGIEKLKGVSWWEGSAVWYVIGMEEFIPHDFAFMKNFPLAIVFLSMATLIFEIYFIFAVWNKKLKGPWLLVGFLFHLSTAIFMNLWFFFITMTSAYLLFLPRLQLRDKFSQVLFGHKSRISL